jgi:glycolate oxidase FAD binding subunit
VARAAEPWLAELASIVGEELLTAEPAECAALAAGGKAPQCVVYPATPESVAAVLHFATERGLAVIPCRNATKLSIGNPPRRYDIALSVKQLNQVWRYEPDDLTVSVEAGMKLGDFQHFLARRRLWIPLDPPGGDRSSLGGIVAANSSGPLRMKYGAPRDMVLGLRVATTAGKIIKTGGRVVKNVAGYDLTKLFVGSLGTLGVVVEINLKLFPAPVRRSTWAFHSGSLSDAQRFQMELVNSPLAPLRAVMMDDGRKRFSTEGSPEASDGFEFWIEFGGSERVISRSTDSAAKLARCAGLAAREIPDDAARLGWQRITECSPPDGANCILLKASLPLSGAEEYVERVRTEASAARVPVACVAYCGSGIVRIFLMTNDSVPPVPAIIDRLRMAACAKGGSLVVERCPVEMGSGVDAWGPAGDGFGLMRQLKELWDPNGTLSPGRYVGGL